MSERRITVHDPNTLERRGLRLLAEIESAAMTTDVRSFLKYLLQEAQNKRSSAGFSGSWGDGGASQLENEVEVYLAGVRLTTPSQWTEYHKVYSRSTDPEYAKYIELKARFGD